MKLIDKYITSQILIATILGIVLFIIIWISPEILFRIIRQTVYGEITPNIALKLFIFEIPEILGKAIPIGLLLGSLFVFDKLSKNFELIIMRNIGISFIRLALPIMLLSSLFSFMCFITYDKLIPYSTVKIKEIKKHKDNTQFVYIDKYDNEKPKQAVIVTCFDGQKAYNLNVLNFSEQISKDRPLLDNIITAENVIFNDDKWILKNGINYQIASDGVYENINKFETIDILKGKAAQKALNLMKYSVKKDSELTNSQLLSYIDLLKTEKLTDEYNFMLNKFYQRYSQAFSCILLAICGVLLGYNKPRQTRAFGFTTAVGIIFVYYITAPFIDLLAEKGILLPIVAAYIPCLFVAACIAGLLKLKEI